MEEDKIEEKDDDDKEEEEDMKEKEEEVEDMKRKKKEEEAQPGGRRGRPFPSEGPFEPPLETSHPEERLYTSHNGFTTMLSRG